MKRGVLFLMSCLAAFSLAAFSLAACQVQKPTAAENYWSSAAEEKSLMEYVVENRENIDVEALKAEAKSKESTLSQQFKATALLCGMEYWKEAKAEDIENPWYGILINEKSSAFRRNHWDSAPYAVKFLEKVNTDEEAFWESLNDAFAPYDCFLPIFAAADQLDGQTIEKLLSDLPAGKNYDDKFKHAVDQWIRKKPEKIPGTGKDFIKADYFKEWKITDWKETYFYSAGNPDLIHTSSVADAITYIGYLRSPMLPMLEKKFDKAVFKRSSEIYDGKTYITGLLVVVDEKLNLKEPEEGKELEWIETEGKTVAAFYQNPHSEERKGSPAPLRVLGDFMMNLPEEEFPETLDAVDYYLVLTPQYEPGDFYQDRAGNKSEIQMICSSTSIDLYEAGTGSFLCHLGTVREEPPAEIVHNMADEPVEYPKPIGADELIYIYHNINEPEKYESLVEHETEFKTELAVNEPLFLDKWEVTYSSGRRVKSFVDRIFQYTPKEGNEFVIGTFIVTNKGTKKETFLPRMYNPSKDLIVRLTDSKRENFYDCMDSLTYSKSLVNSYFEQGETKEGEIIFEVPQAVLKQEETFYIAVTFGEQTVFYPLKQ